jgi:hypothetical protein
VPAKSKAIEDPMERIARVLAIIAVKGLDNEEAARRLLAAGFDAKQIGGLLDVNPNFANMAKLRSGRLNADGHHRPAAY